MAEHATLTGASLHEPKGCASASADQVYVSDGAGSGAWTTLNQTKQYVLTAVANDISVAETAYIPIPKAGTVVRATTVLMGALTGADLGIDIQNSSSLSMGTITVTQVGSAAGDIDTVDPVSNNTVTDNDYIKVIGDGAPTAHTGIMISLLIEY